MQSHPRWRLLAALVTAWGAGCAVSRPPVAGRSYVNYSSPAGAATTTTLEAREPSDMSTDDERRNSVRPGNVRTPTRFLLTPTAPVVATVPAPTSVPPPDSARTPAPPPPAPTAATTTSGMVVVQGLGPGSNDDRIDALASRLGVLEQELASSAGVCRDVCRASGGICSAAFELCELTGELDRRCERARDACERARRQRDGACPVCPRE